MEATQCICAGRHGQVYHLRMIRKTGQILTLKDTDYPWIIATSPFTFLSQKSIVRIQNDQNIQGGNNWCGVGHFLVLETAGVIWFPFYSWHNVVCLATQCRQVIWSRGWEGADILYLNQLVWWAPRPHQEKGKPGSAQLLSLFRIWYGKDPASSHSFFPSGDWQRLIHLEKKEQKTKKREGNQIHTAEI